MENGTQIDETVVHDQASDSIALAKGERWRQIDPRPPLDDTAATSDWLLRRYMVTERDNKFSDLLKMVLQRDKDGQFLKVAKKYQDETMGICVTAPAREGKTFMVTQILTRIFGQKIEMDKCSDGILYCRLKTAATATGVYTDICRATGLDTFPERLTRPEAQKLASHRLKMAGVKIVIIDELHNLISNGKEAMNLFLKGFFHNDEGLCLIAIGTERLRAFVYEDPDNAELSGRMIDFRLAEVLEADAIILIHQAIKKLSGDIELKVGRSITSDPYFANRVFDGCKGSFGRCMRLVSSAIIYAMEDGANAVEIEDFSKTFDLQFLHFNPENPFTSRDWQQKAVSAPDNPDLSDSLFGDGHVEPAKKKRGRPRKAVKK